MVIWLLGISGSGKTTIGSWVVDKLKSDNNLETFLIDGDLGYETKDKRTNIKRIILVGRDLKFDIPEGPDLVIDTDN